MRQISTLLLLLFFATSGFAVFSSLTTQKIDIIKNNSSTDIKLDPSGDVILNNLTGGRVLYLNTDKEIKSSSLSQTDLESDLMRLSGDQSASGEKTFTGKLIASTTDNASIPCPVMTEAQRDLIATPELGDCIFNSSSETLNVYDGATWKSAGGGISQWVTGFNYAINDIVVYVGEIYQALTAHTSGTFATDLTNGEWVKIADTIQAKGLNQATNTFKTIAAPNNQVTSIGTNQALLETGNNNLLANPSFEHATYDTSWTYTGDATKDEDTTNVIDGNKSIMIDAANNGGEGQSFRIEQKTTLYATQFNGAIQGVANVKIRNTNPQVRVCAIVDDVDVDCISVGTSNVWIEYVIPFVMGSTNNGIVVKSVNPQSSSIGVTYIDNAFVEIMPATMMPEVSQAQFLGRLNYATAAGCVFSITGTTITNFSADTDCATPTVTSSSIKIPSTKIPAVVLPAGSQAGTYKFVATGLFYGSPSSDSLCSYRFSDGTNNTSLQTGGNATNSGGASPVIHGEITYNGALNADTTINIQSREDTGNAAACTIELNDNQEELSISVYYYPPKSKIYSQQCKSSLDCENVFSWTVAANGTVSGENLDVINGNCTNADPRVCTFNTPIFTVAPNCATDGTESITAVSSTTISIDNNSQATKVICQKSPPDYKEKNVITGTFANVVTAPNIAKPITIKGRFAGGSETTACTSSPCTLYRSNGFITNITRGGTGAYVINTSSGLLFESLSCSFTCNGTERRVAMAGSTSVTAYNLSTQNTSLGTNADAYCDYICIGSTP